MTRPATSKPPSTWPASARYGFGVAGDAAAYRHTAWSSEGGCGHAAADRAEKRPGAARCAVMLPPSRVFDTGAAEFTECGADDQGRDDDHRRG